MWDIQGEYDKDDSGGGAMEVEVLLSRGANRQAAAKSKSTSKRPAVSWEERGLAHM